MDKKIKVGDKVAFNNLKDATWFEVLEIKGFTLTLREEGTEYASMMMDRCYVKQVREN